MITFMLNGVQVTCETVAEAQELLTGLGKAQSPRKRRQRYPPTQRRVAPFLALLATQTEPLSTPVLWEWAQTQPMPFRSLQVWRTFVASVMRAGWVRNVTLPVWPRQVGRYEITDAGREWLKEWQELHAIQEGQ